HCATIATVEDGRVIRLDPDDDHPNGGVMCIKGKAAPELVYHPDRLNYPLRRTRPKGDPDPGWQRVSWDEALDDIAKRLLSIHERHGSQSIALGKGTKSGTSVDDVERWLGRLLYLLGSPNWVSTTHVCNWHKDTGFSYTFGTNLPTPDLGRSKTFLLWGHNPSSTSLILAHDIVAARARGMKTVVVDPRRVGIGSQADILLQVRPGTDGALALALIHCLMEESWYDAGFGHVGEIAAAFAPEKSEKITWVPADKVWKTALLLAHNRPVSMYMWNGLGQHTNATQTSRAIASLYALLGDIDRAGGNVIFPKVPTNDVSGKEFLSTEMAALRVGRERKPLGPPATPGNCAAYDIFTAILEERPYPVKAFLNFGSNTVMSTGDSQRGREALCALEFAVAVD